MRKSAFILLIFLVGQIARGAIFTGVVDPGLRVLHLDLDSRFIGQIQDIGRELGWRLTSWNPLESSRSAARFLGSLEDPISIYTITSERAERIWATNWAYFVHFDMIIVSAVLAPIFLGQKRREGFLVVGIPKDFDYCAQQGLQAYYYRLFQRAANMPNVQLVDISNGWE